MFFFRFTAYLRLSTTNFTWFILNTLSQLQLQYGTIKQPFDETRKGDTNQHHQCRFTERFLNSRDINGIWKAIETFLNQILTEAYVKCKLNLQTHLNFQHLKFSPVQDGGSPIALVFPTQIRDYQKLFKRLSKAQ